jgi:hypothetical protein
VNSLNKIHPFFSFVKTTLLVLLKSEAVSVGSEISEQGWADVVGSIFLFDADLLRLLFALLVLQYKS